MSVSIVRGVKLGSLSAISFGVISPINNMLHHKQIMWETTLSGSLLALLVMGITGAFTDKIGFDSGEA